MAHPETVKDIETDMAFIMTEWDRYERIKEEYNRMLSIMGNVDGDENVCLVLVAAANLDALDGIGPIKDKDNA